MRRGFRWISVPALVVAMLGLLCSPADSSRSQATARAAGTVAHPSTLFVSVGARPDQPVIGGWSLRCSDTGRKSSSTGTLRGLAPFTTAVKPTSDDSESCSLSAWASLVQGGKVTVSLSAITGSASLPEGASG